MDGRGFFLSMIQGELKMLIIEEIKQDKVKRIAVYVRSSKDLHNVSCDAQERQIKEFVKAEGHQVFRIFTELINITSFAF